MTMVNILAEIVVFQQKWLSLDCLRGDGQNLISDACARLRQRERPERAVFRGTRAAHGGRLAAIAVTESGRRGDPLRKNGST